MGKDQARGMVVWLGGGGCGIGGWGMWCVVCMRVGGLGECASVACEWFGGTASREEIRGKMKKKKEKKNIDFVTPIWIGSRPTHNDVFTQ